MIDRFFGEYRWLSNFWPSEVRLNNFTFPTVEHAYQAAKSTSDKTHLRFSQMETPAMAKKAGKLITTLRPDWDRIKIDVMAYLLQQKFADPELAALLEATGDQDLVEGNTWGDVFWGKCNGIGENHLGKLLMKIRYQKRNPTYGPQAS